MKGHRNAALITLAALIFVTPTAHAQVNLAWNNCITQPAAAEIVRYACDGSLAGTPYRAVMSFIAPDDLHAFVGVQMILDVASLGGGLPDFWRMGSDECRNGAFGYPAALSGVGTGATGACRNPWLGAFMNGGSMYCSEYVCWPGDVAMPGHAKVLFAFARNSDNPLVLERGAQYIAGAFSIDTDKDIDAGAGRCAGCEQAVMLTLNEVSLYQLYQDGPTPPQEQDIYYLNAPATRASILWQTDKMPAHNRTWGAIKAIYR